MPYHKLYEKPTLIDSDASGATLDDTVATVDQSNAVLTAHDAYEIEHERPLPNYDVLLVYETNSLADINVALSIIDALDSHNICLMDSLLMAARQPTDVPGEPPSSASIMHTTRRLMRRCLRMIVVMSQPFMDSRLLMEGIGGYVKRLSLEQRHRKVLLCAGVTWERQPHLVVGVFRCLPVRVMWSDCCQKTYWRDLKESIEEYRGLDRRSAVRSQWLDYDKRGKIIRQNYKKVGEEREDIKPPQVVAAKPPIMDRTITIHPADREWLPALPHIDADVGPHFAMPVIEAESARREPAAVLRCKRIADDLSSSDEDEDEEEDGDDDTLDSNVYPEEELEDEESSYQTNASVEPNLIMDTLIGSVDFLPVHQNASTPRKFRTEALLPADDGSAVEVAVICTDATEIEAPVERPRWLALGSLPAEEVQSEPCLKFVRFTRRQQRREAEEVQKATIDENKELVTNATRTTKPMPIADNATKTSKKKLMPILMPKPSRQQREADTKKATIDENPIYVNIATITTQTTSSSNRGHRREKDTKMPHDDATNERKTTKITPNMSRRQLIREADTKKPMSDDKIIYATIRQPNTTNRTTSNSNRRHRRETDTKKMPNDDANNATKTTKKTTPSSSRQTRETGPTKTTRDDEKKDDAEIVLKTTMPNKEQQPRNNNASKTPKTMTSPQRVGDALKTPYKIRQGRVESTQITHTSNNETDSKATQKPMKPELEVLRAQLKAVLEENHHDDNETSKPKPKRSLRTTPAIPSSPAIMEEEEFADYAEIEQQNCGTPVNDEMWNASNVTLMHVSTEQIRPDESVQQLQAEEMRPHRRASRLRRSGMRGKARVRRILHYILVKLRLAKK